MKANLIQVRVDKRQLAQWKKAAKFEKRIFSDWVRVTLDSQAGWVKSAKRK